MKVIKSDNNDYMRTILNLKLDLKLEKEDNEIYYVLAHKSIICGIKRVISNKILTTLLWIDTDISELDQQKLKSI
jgi:hypothetical protein